MPLQRLMSKQSNKTNLINFGANLKGLRESRGLSYREMSYACDIDYSKIAKIEKGQVNITLTTILQLAKALEVQPVELFKSDFE